MNLQAATEAAMILIGLGPVLFLIGTLVVSIFMYGTIRERVRRSGKTWNFLSKLVVGSLCVLVSGLTVATVLWFVLNSFFEGIYS